MNWNLLLGLVSLFLAAVPKAGAGRGDMEIPEPEYEIKTTLNYFDLLDFSNRATSPTTQQLTTTKSTTVITTRQQTTTQLTSSLTTNRTTHKPSTTQFTIAPTNIRTTPQPSTTTSSTITADQTTKPTTKQPITPRTSTLATRLKQSSVLSTKTTTKTPNLTGLDQTYGEDDGLLNSVVTYKVPNIKVPSNGSEFDLPTAVLTETPKVVKTTKDKSDNLNMLYIIAGCLAAVLAAIAAVTTTLFWLHSKGKLGSAGFLAVPTSAA